MEPGSDDLGDDLSGLELYAELGDSNSDYSVSDEDLAGQDLTPTLGSEKVSVLKTRGREFGWAWLRAGANPSCGYGVCFFRTSGM